MSEYDSNQAFAGCFMIVLLLAFCFFGWLLPVMQGKDWHCETKETVLGVIESKEQIIDSSAGVGVNIKWFTLGGGQKIQTYNLYRVSDGSTIKVAPEKDRHYIGEEVKETKITCNWTE